jgi:hypothetical protein
MNKEGRYILLVKALSLIVNQLFCLTVIIDLTDGSKAKHTNTFPLCFCPNHWALPRWGPCCVHKSAHKAPFQPPWNEPALVGLTFGEE